MSRNVTLQNSGCICLYKNPIKISGFKSICLKVAFKRQIPLLLNKYNLP